MPWPTTRRRAPRFPNEGRRNLGTCQRAGLGNTQWFATLHSTDQVVFKGHLYFGVVGYHDEW